MDSKVGTNDNDWVVVGLEVPAITLVAETDPAAENKNVIRETRVVVNIKKLRAGFILASRFFRLLIGKVGTRNTEASQTTGSSTYVLRSLKT